MCLDTKGRVWAVLHSDSRGIGTAVGRYFIKAAAEEAWRWFINLTDQDLAFLHDTEGNRVGVMQL